MLRTKVIALGTLWTCIGALGTQALAASTEFDFNDPKGVNAIAFVLDSKLEPIIGFASGISGTVQFDPSAPEKMSGQIEIQSESVRLTSKRMQEVLHSEDWMDVKQFPTIKFVIESVKDVKKASDGVSELTAQGKLTCKGVTHDFTAPVKATYLKGALGKRMRGAEGDLLVLRSTFTISRKKFNIKPGMGPDTVADDIEVRVSIVGGHSTK